MSGTLSTQEKKFQALKHRVVQTLESLQPVLINQPSPSQIISQALGARYVTEGQDQSHEAKQVKRGAARSRGERASDEGNGSQGQGPATEESQKEADKKTGIVQEVRKRRSSVIMYTAQLPPAALLLMHKDKEKIANAEGRLDEPHSRAMNWVGNMQGVETAKRTYDDPLFADAAYDSLIPNDPTDNDTIAVAADVGDSPSDVLPAALPFPQPFSSHKLDAVGGHVPLARGRRGSAVILDDMGNCPTGLGGGRSSGCSNTLQGGSGRSSYKSSVSQSLAVMADCVGRDDDFEEPEVLSGADQALNMLRGVQGGGSNPGRRRSLDYPGSTHPIPMRGSTGALSNLDQPGPRARRDSVGGLGSPELQQRQQQGRARRDSVDSATSLGARSRTSTTLPSIVSPTGSLPKDASLLARGASVRFDRAQRVDGGQQQLTSRSSTEDLQPKGSGSHGGDYQSKLRRRASRLSNVTDTKTQCQQDDEDEDDDEEEEEGRGEEGGEDLSRLLGSADDITGMDDDAALMMSWLLTGGARRGATTAGAVPGASSDFAVDADADDRPEVLRTRSKSCSAAAAAVVAGQPRAPRVPGGVLPPLQRLSVASGRNSSCSGETDDGGGFLISPNKAAFHSTSSGVSALISPDPRLAPSSVGCLSSMHLMSPGPGSRSGLGGGSTGGGGYPLTRAASTQPTISAAANYRSESPGPKAKGGGGGGPAETSQQRTRRMGSESLGQASVDPPMRSASCMPTLPGAPLAMRGAPSPTPPKLDRTLHDRLNKYNRPRVGPTPDALFARASLN